MSYAAYMELSDDLPSDCRRRERELFDTAISKLQSISNAESISTEVIEAVSYVRKLWIALITDLKSPGNGFSDELKSNLISIGVWICEAANSIAHGNFSIVPRVIELNSMIRDGLE